jgi:hypothetical protein
MNALYLQHFNSQTLLYNFKRSIFVPDAYVCVYIHIHPHFTRNFWRGGGGYFMMLTLAIKIRLIGEYELGRIWKEAAMA